MEVWVHSPHLRQQPKCNWCNRQLVSLLAIFQLTLVVVVTMIYLPGLADRKYSKLISSDHMLEDHEVFTLLDIDHHAQPPKDVSKDWGSRGLKQQKINENADILYDSNSMIKPDDIEGLHGAEIGIHGDANMVGHEKPVTEMGLPTSTSPLPTKPNRRQRKRKRKNRSKNKIKPTPGREEEIRSTEKPFNQRVGGKPKSTKPTSEMEDGEKKSKSKRKLLYSEVYDPKRKIIDVDLLVIVNTAHDKSKRRDAVRDTWFTECTGGSEVRCFFFTDNYALLGDKAKKDALLKESRMYKDMVFQPTAPGILFGHRLLFQLQWARAHFNFKYLLRVDDDVMFCLQHLLHDLKSLRRENLQWGFLHCEVPEMVYIDEGIIMFSSDVVKKYLSQDPEKIRCHPFGDQTVGLWIQDLGLDPYNLYVHDQRIHHNPPASYETNLLEKKYLCNEYIALHGVYPEYMSEFWSRRGRPSYLEYDEPNTAYLCDKPFVMFWDKFTGQFFERPNYCYKGDVWNMTTKTKNFGGRQSDLLAPAPKDRNSWKYSEDIMDRPKKAPKILKNKQ